MAAISPLKELINNSTLSDMSKTLDKDPFPKVKIGFELSHFSHIYSHCLNAFLRLIRKL